MPVFTVMAEATEGEAYKLHNEAVKAAADAVATVERFRHRGYRNIRVYRETQEINETELREAVTVEKASGARR